MKNFSKSRIEQIFTYSDFIPFLKKFYAEDVTVPPRPHYSIQSEISNATLLLMPSWQSEKYIGVKVVNVFPDNHRFELPSVQGIYILMDGLTGQILATFDGLTLTTKRTAAISAVACDILAKPKCKSILMIGTGNLSAELIQAHHSIRDLDEVFIWGRNISKSQKKCKEIKALIPDINIQSVIDKDQFCAKADIISVATLAKDPVLFGEHVTDGTHIDLVGSYSKESREADDNCLVQSKIFVDDYGALKESGDLYIPLDQGVIKEKDVIMDLNELVTHGYLRKSKDETTLFKSVGNAKADLALAIYLYENDAFQNLENA